MSTHNAFIPFRIHLAPSVRRMAAAVCALVLTVLLLSGCGGETDAKKAGQAPPPAVPVTVAPVIQKTVPLYSEYAAQTGARDTVDVRARVEAFLEGIHFEEGKPVKKGQLLFTLDKSKYQADLQSSKARLAKAKADLQFATENVAVESAKAKLDQAKAELGKADLDVNRLTPLAKEKAVPQQDLDNALVQQEVAKSNVSVAKANYDTTVLNQKVTIDQANAEVSATEAAVQRSELDLSYCTIGAPIDGLVGQRLVSIGNLVGRGEPTVLATISALDPLRVTFSVSESEYLALAKRYGKTEAMGKVPLELILADGNVHPHKGRLTVIERSVAQATGTLTMVAEFPNPEHIVRPGQFGRVRGAAYTAENAILIPQLAIMEQQSAKTVYVVDNENKVALRTVTLGPRFDNLVLVKEGVKAGERVIVDGMQKVRPGMSVTATVKSVAP
jgi:membrane fusion protein (multidrug efflux system)